MVDQQDTPEPTDLHEVQSEDAPAGDDRAADSRVVKAIRLISVAPLVIAGLLIVLVPEIRQSLLDGFRLLMAGDMGGLQQWTAQLGPWAMVVTGFLMIAQAIAAPVPAVLVTAANSFLLGPFWGGLYSVATANIAAAICYGIGRGFGSGVVERLISSEAMDRTAEYFENHGTTTVFAARLIPLVPFDPVSYLAGMLKMPFWPFFWATLAGQLPAGMAYSYLVQNVTQPNMSSIYIVCSLIAAAAITGHLLMRRARRK